jgi:hypothetical protein
VPRSTAHRRLLLTLTIAICALVLGPLTAAQAAVGPSTAISLTPTLTSLAGTANTVLQSYTTRSSADDPRYYASGTWYATDGPECWLCYSAAADGAATLSQLPGADSQLVQTAVDTFNSDIAHYQLPNGGFADPYPTVDQVGTGFFTVFLGMGYLELRNAVSPQTLASWSTSIQKAADYLINSGMSTWYTNGNVVLRQTEVFWLAWVITHQQRFLTAYNNDWNFAIAPDAQRWPGFGLHLTTRPARADGADGAGYLAESGGGAPGFDPSYTDAQLDTATDLYVLTRDPRYLRLMNLEFNQLRPLVDASWTLNATGGTRKNYMTPFMNPALSVLAASGDRPDLVGLVSGQLASVQSQYAGAMTYTNVNFYKGFESWLSMPLLDRLYPQGLAPATTGPTTPATTATTTTKQPAPTRPPAPIRQPASTSHSAVADAAAALGVTRGSARSVVPRVTVTNVPQGATVRIALTALVASSRHRAVRTSTPRVLRRTVHVHAARRHLVVLFPSSTRELARLRHGRWTLTARVTVARGDATQQLATGTQTVRVS